MKVLELFMWLLFGILSFVACGTLIPRATDVAEATPTETVRGGTMPVATRPVSVLPTPPAETTLAAPVQVSATPTPMAQATPSTAGQISPRPTPTPVTASPGSTAESPATSQPAAEQPAPDRPAKITGEAMIIYRRSGGFAGVDEQWTIYPDGRITANDGGEWQVTVAQVEQLLRDIEALGFFDLDSRYMPFDTCCDRFTYEITVRSGDRVHTVTTIDAAPNTPPELQQVIAEISRLLAEAHGG
jgi:hypothetical protein